MVNKKIESQISDYYTKKLEEHGNSHWGVDWNSIESQELRFEQLSKVLPIKDDFSVIDYGCGYGALFPYLQLKGFGISSFTGFDISNAMIDSAKESYKENKNARWVTSSENIKADYVLASGIFNVRLKNSDAEWKQYIIDTLNQFDSMTSKGFAFNVLTGYSDKEYQRDYLYYADPLYFFDYCKRNFALNVALLHDYNLYEFTLIIKK
jgi:SAM-dependent methyltransferase